MNILETIHQCRQELPKLRAALETRGIKQPVFTEPQMGGDSGTSLLDLHNALAGEVDRLANRLKLEMGTTPGAAPAPTPPAKIAVAATTTALTSAEISRLTWAEKTQLAGGFLTSDEARQIATERGASNAAVSITDECLAAKLAPESKKAAPDLTGKNLTEQCLAQSTELADRQAGRK